MTNLSKGIFLTLFIMVFYSVSLSQGTNASSREMNKKQKNSQELQKIEKTKIKGRIIRSEKAASTSESDDPKGKRVNHVLVVVATEGGREELINVGPDWYIKNYGLTFKEGQQIEAAGFREDLQGRHIFMAMELEMGSWKVTLRDGYGKPLWKSSLAPAK